jgi:Na+-driven multidrug efflux pump
VLDMGITGAALASGISATVVFALFLSKFIAKNSFLSVGRCEVDFKAIGRMIYNGSSEAITQFSADCHGHQNSYVGWCGLYSDTDYF